MRYNKLELDTLENRRRKARLTFMYKIINNQIDIDISNYLTFNKESRTRNSHQYKLVEPFCKKDVFKFSFFPRTARDWNKLPVEIFKTTSLNNFKNNLV